jgi:hypothetical protein
VVAGVTGDIWTLEDLHDRAMECVQNPVEDLARDLGGVFLAR